MDVYMYVAARVYWAHDVSSRRRDGITDLAMPNALSTRTYRDLLYGTLGSHGLTYVRPICRCV
jgi:hypothetical protein